MNVRVLLAFAAIALPLLSGCFGYPEGTIRPGDSVTIRFDAVDPNTGQTLATARTVQFTVGSGGSGLGMDVERRLVGHRENDTFELESRDDASRQYYGEYTIDRYLEPFPADNVVDRETFTDGIGAPSVGMTFPIQQVYRARVTAFNETHVEYRFDYDDQPDEIDAPAFGVILVLYNDGDDVMRRLDPVVGATFSVRPPSPFSAPPPFPLEPGSYQVTGATDEHVLLAYNPGQDPRFLVPDLDISITITAHDAAARSNDPVDGNYAARDSPQVRGPRPGVQASGDEESEDGHADDDHTH
jgi:hypothetical protein